LDEKIYQLALHLTEGLGGVMIRHIISHFGTAEAVFQANFKQLVRVNGVGEKMARKILEKQAIPLAEKEFQKTQSQGIQLFFYTDSNYPKRLKGLYDAPAMLYWKGSADLNKSRFVGIVGTRNATDYGRSMTEKIIYELQNQHITVVSGLALGIDIIAHKACLRHDVPTIAVMATGVDVIYPKNHEKYAGAICSNGGLITEGPLQTKPDAPRFVSRNRIIAGMSDAIIVVESAQKGGSLITAEYGNNYNRDVFAMPGNVDNPYSQGCLNLIKNHKAQIFTNTNDFLEQINWSKNDEVAEPKSNDTELNHTFSQEESQIIAAIRQATELQIDDLSWALQIHPSKLSNILLNLELQGFIKSLPGKRLKLS
jgi:DNA processing protein